MGETKCFEPRSGWREVLHEATSVFVQHEYSTEAWALVVVVVGRSAYFAFRPPVR